MVRSGLLNNYIEFTHVSEPADDEGEPDNTETSQPYNSFMKHLINRTPDELSQGDDRSNLKGKQVVKHSVREVTINNIVLQPEGTEKPTFFETSVDIPPYLNSSNLRKKASQVENTHLVENADIQFTAPEYKETSEISKNTHQGKSNC